MENKEILLLYFPQQRDDIKGTFECLAEKNWQNEKLLNHYPVIYFEYLLITVYHTLYDDHELDERDYALSQVGRIFYNEDEAIKIHEFCYWFHELSGEIGEDEPNEAYLDHPEWQKVWQGAEEMIKLMEENDKKYNIRAS